MRVVNTKCVPGSLRGDNRLTTWEKIAEKFGHEAVYYFRFSVAQLRELCVLLQVECINFNNAASQ